MLLSQPILDNIYITSVRSTPLSSACSRDKSKFVITGASRWPWEYSMVDKTGGRRKGRVLANFTLTQR